MSFVSLVRKDKTVSVESKEVVEQGKERGEMNRFMCFCTGGHKYSDANMTAEIAPDDFNTVILTNPCIKCGSLSVFYMNVKEQIAKDSARMKGGDTE